MFRITSICLIILFLGLMSASITHAQTENYKFIKQWGSKGSYDEQFNFPYSVAVDSSGNVYVTDAGLNRIQKFDGNGKFITKWGSKGSGDGQFNSPEGIAVDSMGNVYVADTLNDRIQKFNSNGKFISKIQCEFPEYVSVDSLGNIYVDVWSSNYVEKLDSNGRFIIKWGSFGFGNGQFNGPMGIAVDSSGYVYVGDLGRSRILQKFDSNGNYITQWDWGTDHGQFDSPEGVAVDSSNNVYIVANSLDKNYRIEKFDSNGKFITTWGSSGSGDGQFNWPMGIAVDSSGNVYIADSGNYRIEKFAPTKPLVIPIAAFSASPTSGKAPLSVKFKDKSTGSPTSWKWSFGDKSTSTAQNPTHKYTKAGKYTVSLTVKNAKGSNTKTVSNYIIVKSK